MKRRQFLNYAGVTAGAILIPDYSHGVTLFQKSSPIKGINLGAITYSFRSMPSSADDLLGYLAKLGLRTTELMGGPAEEYAGAPVAPPFRREPTEAERKQRDEYNQNIRKWRLSASMDKFKELKKKYSNEGVSIDIIKFPLDRMSEEEVAYAFNVARAVGAKGITLERSDDAVKNLAKYADQYKTLIGYHNHAEVNFNSWDAAMGYSKYNAINLDIGHYVAGTNESPIPLIKKYSDRILNLHMKDRKKNNGDNVPWGQGDTPIKEVLQLMRDQKYKFMATIELEYPIPEGSDAVKEVAKCIEYCKEAIA